MCPLRSIFLIQSLYISFSMFYSMTPGVVCSIVPMTFDEVYPPLHITRDNFAVLMTLPAPFIHASPCQPLATPSPFATSSNHVQNQKFPPVGFWSTLPSAYFCHDPLHLGDGNHVFTIIYKEHSNSSHQQCS